MAKTRPHFTTEFRVGQVMRGRLPYGWIIPQESPIRLDDQHVPLPDLAVIRGPIEIYDQEDRMPTVADVGVVIEIAYSSLSKDLGPRTEVLARNGVPSYWVLNVVRRRAVEHRGPTVLDGVGSYAHVRTLSKGDELPLVLDGVQVALIPVAELLP